MIFKKEWLQDNVAYSSIGDVVIEKEIVDNRRWSIVYACVFKHEGKFYRTSYSRGATEQQAESPYEYELEDIDCKEVFPVEKKIIVYE